MKIIDRYIAKELIVPFAIGFGGFLLLLIGNLLFSVIEYVLKHGIPLGTLVQLVIYSIPKLMIYTFPVSSLFAVSLTINRLARDSEITAMRIASVSIWRLLVPIACFGVLMSIAAFFNGDKIAPWAQHRAQEVVRRMYNTQDQMSNLIQEDVFFRLDRNVFYVRQVHRKAHEAADLEDVTIYQTPIGEGYPVEITAKRAFCKDNIWYLQDGIRRELDAKGFTKLEFAFKNLTINLKRPLSEFLPEYENYDRSIDELNFMQLKERIKASERGKVRVRTDYILDLHMRFALPLACLVVGLCSAPLGLKFARSGSFMGILLSIVLVFLYYNTMLLCQYLGTSGKVPPALGAWAPNIIFAAAGAYLIWRER